jgi:hypothetical protein
MGEEATAAEVATATEIIVEGSETLTPGQSDEGSDDSLFGESVPDVEESSSEVDDPASSQSSADKEVVDPDEQSKQEEVIKPGEEEGEVKEEDKIPKEPDDVTKLTEHKTNLEKALAEARAKNKSLQFMVDQKESAQPAEVEAGETPKVDPDFKVLSKEEFETLKEESAMDALQYMHDLQTHKEAAFAAKTQADTVAAEKESMDSLIADSLEQISLAVPGVYENAAVGQKLTDYAVEKGFDNEALAVLSNPATMVIVPGSNKPVALGKAAVSFVKFCNDSMTAPESSRADIEKEVTERVTKELLTKFKDNPSGIGLDDVPSSDNGAPKGWAPKTEAELRAMSQKDRDAYYEGS